MAAMVQALASVSPFLVTDGFPDQADDVECVAILAGELHGDVRVRDLWCVRHGVLSCPECPDRALCMDSNHIRRRMPEAVPGRYGPATRTGSASVARYASYRRLGRAALPAPVGRMVPSSQC